MTNVRWSATEDVQIAPPGWTGADGEACVWRDDLNAGKCQPLEGWTQVHDPVSKSDILIRNRVSPLVSSLDIDGARAWSSLSGWEQIKIRLGHASIHHFVVFTRGNCSDPRDALTCVARTSRWDAQRLLKSASQREARGRAAISGNWDAALLCRDIRAIRLRDFRRLGGAAEDAEVFGRPS